MTSRWLNVDSEKEGRFTNGALQDSKELNPGGRGKASQPTLLGAKGLRPGGRGRTNQPSGAQAATNAHQDILKGLIEDQDLTTYMKNKKFIYNKGMRDETLLHCIALGVGEDNHVDTGQPETEEENQAHDTAQPEPEDENQAHSTTELEPDEENQAYDKTDWQEYGEEPHIEDLLKKRLFQWVVLRKPSLVKFPGIAKKNIIMFSLEERERIAVLFWLLEVVILDGSIRQLENGVCLKTETTPCDIPLDPALLDGFEEVRRPSVNGNANHLTYAKCFHEKVAGEPKVMEQLKKNSEELRQILVQILGQKPLLFHAFIQEFEWESSVKAFEKLVHLCCKVQKLPPQIPESPVTPQPLNPLVHLDENLGTPLHFAVEKLSVSNAGDLRIPNFKGLGEMIKLLVKHHPQAIYVPYKDRTPYQNLLAYKKASSTPEILDVEKYFKEVCIGDPDQTRAEKMKYLYPKGVEERDIEFDMREETKVSINRDFLNRLDDMNRQYETVLGCIDLPPILAHSKMTSIPQEQQSEAPTEAPTEAEPMTSYVHVFEWLQRRNGGTDKVFKVRVNDLDGQPHKESDIRKALHKVEVDEWDWQKLDISSYTIVEAAKNVKTLNLYWSGSNEVLQGWSCKNTLATLPKLKKINLITYQDPDDKEVLDEYVKQFRKRFKRRRDDVEIEVCPESNSLGRRGIGNNERQAEVLSQRQHAWLKFMENFHKNFSNMPKSKADEEICPKVKVALIDDGVALDRETIFVKGGTSFYQSTQSDPAFRQYFVAPGGHGTTMAAFICLVCPDVELYAVRLNDSEHHTGGRKFTVKSCAEALEWAIDTCQADIVSMSWSFKEESHQKDEEKEYITKLRSLVIRAKEEGKSLFCSLPDTAPIEDYKKYLPVSLDGVIRIGSATSLGRFSEKNSDDSIEFALPGEMVLSEEEKKFVTGSSVATAIAAGFAALIIYCVELAEGMGLTNVQSPRNPDTIKAAFGRMISTSQPKYPNPALAFTEPFPVDDAETSKVALTKMVRLLGF